MRLAICGTSHTFIEPVGKLPCTVDLNSTTTGYRPDIRVDGLGATDITVLIDTHEDHASQPLPR